MSAGPAELLRHEMRVRYGPVGDALDGMPVPWGSNCLEGDSFLLRTAEGIAFHYRKGQGVTIGREADCRPDDEQLYLNGTVYAAVASINGFYPLHASAVAHDGRVYAFGGPSGAGKSTMVTALGQHGLPLFCDDTLILDLSDPARPMALPGHKRLKLTPQAIALLDIEPQERVGETIDKFYALPPAGTLDVVLPLAHLTFLQAGESIDWQPVRGSDRLARLHDDHYTSWYYDLASRREAADAFGFKAGLARSITMSQLARPLEADRFGEVAALVAKTILEGRVPE